MEVGAMEVWRKEWEWVGRNGQSIIHFGYRAHGLALRRKHVASHKTAEIDQRFSDKFPVCVEQRTIFKA